jgi:hypothetical protein
MVNKVNNKASGTSCHQESSILSLLTPKDKEKIVIINEDNGNDLLINANWIYI